MISFGKELMSKARNSFVGLVPGTVDWMLYWTAHPEQQDAMADYAKARLAKIQQTMHKPDESLAVVDDEDSLMCFVPSERVHATYPYLFHRRTHVFVLSPNRRELLLRKTWSSVSWWRWSCMTDHVLAEEGYFSAAGRILEKQLGLEVHRGKIREISYDSEPRAQNDFEASKVFEYVLPNLTTISSEEQITSLPVDIIKDAINKSVFSPPFVDTFKRVVEAGELKWK